MKQSGQNLGEYGLALALIVIVSVSVLGLIGNNVSSMFAGTITHKAPAPIVSTTTSTGTGTGATKPFANLPYNKVTMDIGNGQNISFIAPSLKETVDTTGSNGVTGRAAYIMQQLADALKEKGELSEQEYQDLVKLSEIGYQMRDAQAIMEKAIPEGKVFSTDTEIDDFRTKTMVLFNGKEMSYSTLGNNITPNSFGLFLSNSLDSAATGNFNTSMTQDWSSNINQLYAQFFTQLQKIQTSPTFQEKPVLKDLVVNTLSKEIYTSTTLTNSTFNKEALKNVLIPVTGNNSEAICGLSNSISCQKNG